MNPNGFMRSNSGQFVESLSHQRNRFTAATIIEGQSIGAATSQPTAAGTWPVTTPASPPDDPGPGGSADFAGAISAALAMGWPSPVGYGFAPQFFGVVQEVTGFPITGFD